eukprot:764051-Hanusia_phi.AAC.2
MEQEHSGAVQSCRPISPRAVNSNVLLARHRPCMLGVGREQGRRGAQRAAGPSAIIEGADLSSPWRSICSTRTPDCMLVTSLNDGVANLGKQEQRSPTKDVTTLMHP